MTILQYYLTVGGAFFGIQIWFCFNNFLRMDCSKTPPLGVAVLAMIASIFWPITIPVGCAGLILEMAKNWREKHAVTAKGDE